MDTRAFSLLPDGSVQRTSGEALPNAPVILEAFRRAGESLDADSGRPVIPLALAIGGVDLTVDGPTVTGVEGERMITGTFAIRATAPAWEE